MPCRGAACRAHPSRAVLGELAPRMFSPGPWPLCRIQSLEFGMRGPCSASQVLFLSPLAQGQEKRGNEIAGGGGRALSFSFLERDHNLSARDVPLALGLAGCRKNPDPSPKQPGNLQRGSSQAGPEGHPLANVFSRLRRAPSSLLCHRCSRASVPCSPTAPVRHVTPHAMS